MGSLVLIPWHIGDIGDLTLNAVATCRRLRWFLAEAPESTRRQLSEELDVDCADKHFLPLGHDEDPALLERALALLAEHDVGLVAGSGVPCFIDPGAWLVRAVRERGIEVRPLAGASALATVLSTSGVEFERGRASFTFYLFTEAPLDPLPELLERPEEPLVLFLRPARLGACLDVVARHQPERAATVFFDVGKETFRYGNRVETRTVSAWRAQGLAEIHWSDVSDITLLLHSVPLPEGSRPPPVDGVPLRDHPFVQRLRRLLGW